MQDWIRTFWFESKGWLKDGFGIEGYPAHVYFGLALFLCAAILYRRNPRRIF